MIILGIETSCDETACAILQKDEDGIHILSNIVASSANLQAKYGGVIPEQAAREQIKSIIPVIEEALLESRVKSQDLDAVAVTFGPGLIGSLLIGVETAKTLATVWDKPLIPINHLIGHFYANWIVARNSSTGNSLTSNEKTSKLVNETPTFRCLGLLVSGGHTDLVLFKNHHKYQYLGGTRDDAAGECFDKCARLLGLPYPGGPAIAAEAAKSKVRFSSENLRKQTSSKFKVQLPKPMINSKDFDFSFSGLKTAVARIVQGSEFIVSIKNKTLRTNNYELITNLAAAIEQAIVDVLVTKTITAAQKYQVEQIMIAGGVAANQKLVSNLQCTINNVQLKAKLHVPPVELCTDNAAMIAAAAFFQKPIKNPLDLQADPNLTL